MQMRQDRIGIIGLGYVGLITASCFAHRGYHVSCMDVDKEKLDSLRRGEMTMYEPRLEGYFSEGIASNKIELTGTVHEVVSSSDVIYFTVGTPSGPDDLADLNPLKSAVESASDAIRNQKRYVVFAVKSTVPPGTTDGVVRNLLEESGKVAGKDFGLCSNPEFLREGSAVEDLMLPDMIIIGEFDVRTGDRMESLYRKFHGDRPPPIIRTTPSNAELIKHATNAFLATKISFSNTIANVASRVPGCDSKVVLEAIGHDRRIGKEFLRAGLGFGGSCLAKDLRCLISFARRKNYDPTLLNATLAANESQPDVAIELTESLVGSLHGKKVAVLGLAFKPGTDDIREAVSIKVIERLLKKGASITATDPMAMQKAKRILGDRIDYEESASDCIKAKDCAILVTEWNQYSSITAEDFRSLMKSPNVVDGRRLYDSAEMIKKVGFVAVGLYNPKLAEHPER